MRRVIFTDTQFLMKSQLLYIETTMRMMELRINRYEAAVLLASYALKVLRGKDAPKECKEAFAELIREAQKELT